MGCKVGENPLRPVEIRTKVRDIHKSRITKVLTKIMFAFQHVVPRISQQRCIFKFVPWRGRLVDIPPLHTPDKVTSNLQPAPRCKWSWQSHPAITISKGPKIYKFSSLIIVISRWKCAQHPQMAVGSICCGYDTIN